MYHLALCTLTTDQYYINMSCPPFSHHFHRKTSLFYQHIRKKIFFSRRSLFICCWCSLFGFFFIYIDTQTHYVLCFELLFKALTKFNKYTKLTKPIIFHNLCVVSKIFLIFNVYKYNQLLRILVLLNSCISLIDIHFLFALLHNAPI